MCARAWHEQCFDPVHVRCVAVVLICWSVVASAEPHHKRRVARAGEPQSVNLDLHEAPPPAVIDATPVAPAPVTAKPERERRWGVLGGGVALFAAGYALDIGLSYGLNHERAATSFIPVVGPLVQMGDSWAMVKPSATGNPMVDAQANQQIDAVNHTIQQAAYAVLAVDFVLQLAGSTMIIVGAVGTSRGPRERNVAWSVTPTGNGVLVKF